MTMTSVLALSGLYVSIPSLGFSPPLQDVQASFSNGGTVTYQVYDPSRGALKLGSDSNFRYPADVSSSLRSVGGIVSWFDGVAVSYRVYDPGPGTWKAGSDSGFRYPADVSSSLRNVGGVVSWFDGVTVHYRIYDPRAGSWEGGSASAFRYPANVSASLKSAGGVVAWFDGVKVYYRVYDPWRGTWMGGEDEFQTFPVDVSSSLSISSSTVSWSHSHILYTRGYNGSSWYSGSTLPRAAFVISASSGNAPLLVWFTDMSIGAPGVSWNFGNGTGSSSERSPYYTFTGFGRYMVTQNVSGPSGNDSTSTVIVTDTLVPSGAIIINNGADFTDSTSVFVAMSATDNSGVVSAMRYSNDGSAWSAWESYATSKPWTLTPGDGLKTVYFQFKDAADNTSPTAIDTITVVAPTPVVWFSATRRTINGDFATTLMGLVGQRYSIQGSGDLVNWVPLSNLTNSTGSVEFSVSIPSNPTLRFYRAVLLPQ